MSEDKQLLMVTVEATALVQEILEHSKALPPAMIPLGQAALGALLTQALNAPSEQESVELQWNVQGPFGDLTAASDDFGAVRVSIAKPQAIPGEKSSNLGPGVFTCRKLKNHIVTSGIVASSGIVNQDIEDYFRTSEQKHCAIGLTVKLELNEKLLGERPFFVQMARGYLVHFIPEEKGVQEHKMRLLDAHLRELGPLSQWVLDDDSSRATLTMARFITGSPKVQQLHETPVKLVCRCNPDRIIKAMRLLSAQDREHLLSESSAFVEARCEFCGKTYQIDKKDL